VVRFLRYINYLVKLERFCQGILILIDFCGQFLREIGWFKIFEIAVSPEQRRRGKESPVFDRVPR